MNFDFLDNNYTPLNKEKTNLCIIHIFKIATGSLDNLLIEASDHDYM